MLVFLALERYTAGPLLPVDVAIEERALIPRSPPTELSAHSRSRFRTLGPRENSAHIDGSIDLARSFFAEKFQRRLKDRQESWTSFPPEQLWSFLMQTIRIYAANRRLVTSS